MTITLSLYFFLLHKGFPVSSSLHNDDHTASTLDSSYGTKLTIIIIIALMI